jgi:hypothetical protein
MQPVAPNNNPAPTTDFNTAYGELGNVYDPQAAQVNTALAAIPGQQQAAMSSLDQAKVNAFKTIGTTANSRGIFFSGYQPDQQNTYTTTKYDPAVTDLNNKTTAQTQSLQQKLTDISQARSNAAQSLVNDTQTAQATAARQAASDAKSNAALALAASKSSNPLNFSQDDVARELRVGLGAVAGGDGHVAPAQLAKAYLVWKQSGLADNAFWSNFQGLWNPNEGDYQQLFNYYKSNPDKIPT